MGASLCFVFHRATTDSQPRDYSDSLLPKIAPPLIHLSNKQYFCIVFAVNPDGQQTVNRQSTITCISANINDYSRIWVIKSRTVLKRPFFTLYLHLVLHRKMVAERVLKRGGRGAFEKQKNMYTCICQKKVVSLHAVLRAERKSKDIWQI